MHDPWAALRLPDFRRFLTAHFTTTLGIQIQGVVVAWQMYLDTHDPLALGLIGLAEALPNIATALFAGHVADRMDRRKLALLATITLLACSLALALLAGLLWLNERGDFIRIGHRRMAPDIPLRDSYRYHLADSGEILAATTIRKEPGA